MKVTKKVTNKFFFIGLGALVCALGIGFTYAKNVAEGQLPNWDPESYSIVEANGLQFSVNIKGNKADTPVILLHGFPEAAVMWDSFMNELVQNGYYAVAPNQRGYSSGARPLDVEAYQLDHLASDVLEIANNLGIEKFHVVGHDWGAGVGWQLAAKNSDRILSYAAISVPHIDAFGKAYREDSDQYEASDYIRFFQNALVPEYVLSKNDYQDLRAVWTNHEDSEVEHYLQIFKQKNALTSAINWYRANFPAFEVGLNIGKVEVPTTLIWGNKDVALMRSGIEDTAGMVSAEYEFIELDAGHWVIQEEQEKLSNTLLSHLAKYR